MNKPKNEDDLFEYIAVREGLTNEAKDKLKFILKESAKNHQSRARKALHLERVKRTVFAFFIPLFVCLITSLIGAPGLSLITALILSALLASIMFFSAKKKLVAMPLRSFEEEWIDYSCGMRPRILRDHPSLLP